MITVILLDYLRHDFTQRVKDVNLNNAGHPFNLIEIDKKGISAAINDGIFQSTDDVVTMANDIIMPKNWLLNMVNASNAIPQSGMIGIHTVEQLPEQSNVNGIKIWETCPYGNVLITKKAIDKVGFFNLDFDPYGTQDSDYHYRCVKSGLRNYYVEGKAEHIGHDVGNGSEYRKMKDDSLFITWKRADYWRSWYEHNGMFLNYEQESLIINRQKYEQEQSSKS